MIDSNGTPSRASPPSAGLVLARGAGWGAGLGWLVGFFLPYLVDLLTFRDTPANPAILLAGWWWTGPIGLIFGAVAGLVTAAVFLPFSKSQAPALTARLVAVLAGPLIVAGLLYLAFSPRLEVGANETREHVMERIVTFYVVPPGAAMLFGLIFGDRLARSDVSRDHERGGRSGE